ncbi:hypothetical protein AN958_10148 [Leucoagaricus sp. SymC.cos]|nr:hypothetical protein AN958_10148 [Leucoagaricus sp. SymC.cos]
MFLPVDNLVLDIEDAFHLTQTSVAILAISSLIVLVTMHNRREAEFLSQSEQEMILIGGMALFWVAALVAWRGFRGDSPGVANDAASTAVSGRIGRGGYSGDWPCRPSDMYCVVEEYRYW